MKFFSEFGSCCLAPTTLEEPEPLTVAAGNGSSSGGPRSRRGGLTGSKVDCSTQWRPALSAISEDGSVNVTSVQRNGVRTVSTTTKKSPERSGSRAKVRQPSHGSDEFRKGAMPMVIPVFAPTPFMF